MSIGYIDTELLFNNLFRTGMFCFQHLLFFFGIFSAKLLPIPSSPSPNGVRTIPAYGPLSESHICKPPGFSQIVYIDRRIPNQYSFHILSGGQMM